MRAVLSATKTSSNHEMAKRTKRAKEDANPNSRRLQRNNALPVDIIAEPRVRQFPKRELIDC